MKTVWKFLLEPVDQQKVKMPAGAQLLHLDTQHGFPCLWALVDPAQPKVERTFITMGTGHDAKELDDSSFASNYVGSYQLVGGAFVGHVFEKLGGGMGNDPAPDMSGAE